MREHQPRPERRGVYSPSQFEFCKNWLLLRNPDFQQVYLCSLFELPPIVEMRDIVMPRRLDPPVSGW